MTARSPARRAARTIASASTARNPESTAAPPGRTASMIAGSIARTAVEEMFATTTSAHAVGAMRGHGHASAADWLAGS